MKHTTLMVSVLMLGLGTAVALSQEAPPDRGRPEPRDHEDRDHADRPERPDRPPPPPAMDRPERPGMDRPGMDRPGMDRPGGPRFNRDYSGPMGQVELLRGYLEMVDRFSHLARDPASAGIAAVISANDMLKARGQDAVVNYFTKILPNVKNEAVQRAIRIQLIQAYQTAGQQDKAMEQMESLMINAPSGAAGPEQPR